MAFGKREQKLSPKLSRAVIDPHVSDSDAPVLTLRKLEND